MEGDGSLREDLERFARGYEDLLVANLPLIRTMVGEIHRHSLCQHQALKGIFWPMREALVDRLQRASKAGEATAGLNASTAADMFAGSIFSAVLRRAAPGARRDYSVTEYRNACVEIFARGISAK